MTGLAVVYEAYLLFWIGIYEKVKYATQFGFGTIVKGFPASSLPLSLGVLGQKNVEDPWTGPETRPR